MNKNQERFYVDQAASELGVAWEILEERERPDFLIRVGSRKFGLELSEVFNGTIGEKGAELKKAESVNQRTIDTYRQSYAKEGGRPLRVHILGVIGNQSMKNLTERLLSRDLESLQPGERITIRISDHLKAHVTVALKPDWYSVADRVGWVNQTPLQIIQQSVATKSSSLKAYRTAVGPDVRLLLVANRTRASGMMTMDEVTVIDTCGFDTVYFFSYPEYVKVFR